MFSGEYTDLTDLHDSLTRRILYHQPDCIEGQVAPWVLDVMVKSPTLEYPGFDLRKVWLTKSGWNALVRKYIDPETTKLWLDKISGMKVGRRGILHLRSKNIQAGKRGEGARLPPGRQWGSCMLGWTWQPGPYPQLTMHSRTSYVGYMGQLDIGVGAKLGAMAAEAMDVDPAEVAFVWHLGVAQLHPFKTIPWFYQEGREKDRQVLEHPWDLARLRVKYPSVFVVRKEMERIWREDREDKGYGEHHYAQRLRMRQRYHTEVLGLTDGQFHHGSGGRSGMNPFRVTPLKNAPYETLDLKAALK